MYQIADKRLQEKLIGYISSGLSPCQQSTAIVLGVNCYHAGSPLLSCWELTAIMQGNERYMFRA